MAFIYNYMICMRCCPVLLHNIIYLLSCFNSCNQKLLDSESSLTTKLCFTLKSLSDYYGYFNLSSCCNYHLIVLLSLCATSESKSLCYINQNSFFFFLRSFLCLHSRANLSYSFLFLPSYNSLPYREKRIELDIKDLVGVLWACTRVHVSTLKIRFFSCDEWIIKKNSRRRRINITEHDRMTGHIWSKCSVSWGEEREWQIDKEIERDYHSWYHSRWNDSCVLNGFFFLDILLQSLTLLY